ncbi:MAG TPA: signal peptidase I [Ktedonobacterales bacterium]|jgi:signal peptidase I
MSQQHRDRLEFADEPPGPGKPTPPSEPSAARAPLLEKQPSPPQQLLKHYEPRRDLQEVKRLRMLREILETVALTVLMFLVFRLAFQNYRVDGHSMLPTLQDQQFILVNRAAYLFHPPERGDIIIFAYPVDPSQDFVKRIVGIPGDHVQVNQDGLVFINDIQLSEPYVNDQTNPYQPTDTRLGPDQYFVLGDNRGDSSDSRVWGPVPRQNIIGKAWLVYWPLHDIHFVPDANDVFSAIKP